VFQNATCCPSLGGYDDKTTDFQVVPAPPVGLATNNFCEGMADSSGVSAALANDDCSSADIQEQAATNVTVGYKGQINTSAVPITSSYLEAGLCPVNVHWHLGAEHYSLGQFDETGTAPSGHAASVDDDDSRRSSTGNERQGFMCHLYNEYDSRFTTSYDWKHCNDMSVGQTYEIHWPHSKGGACGTPYQYQTPFYDGVFCNATAAFSGPREGEPTGDPAIAGSIGVQSQTYTVINDENYYYPDLIRGMVKDGNYGAEITTYTGSTTGDGRNNDDACSMYAPITWQVDRNCHLISASSFDKLCADMKQQADDMSGDLYPHGSRTLVSDFLAADNHQRRAEMLFQINDDGSHRR